MSAVESPSNAFRFQVPYDQSGAKIRLGWGSYKVRVIDTSREAFTLQVSRKLFRRFQEGTRALLSFQGETWEVKCTAMLQLADGEYHLSLLRLIDRTVVRAPSSPTGLFSSAKGKAHDPTLTIAMLAALVFACVALPGTGDTLGTAPIIRDALRHTWQISLGR
jgi:hypothetical protein